MNFWEEIKPFLRDAGEIEKIRPLVSAHVEESIKDSDIVKRAAAMQVPGLVEAKEKILGEKKDLQAKYDIAMQKYAYFEQSGMTAEKLAELQRETETLRALANGKGGEKEAFEKGRQAALAESKSYAEVLNNEKSQIQNSLDSMRSKYVGSMVKSEIKKVLDVANLECDDYFLAGLIASAKVDYSAEDDKVILQLPHNGGLLPPDKWAEAFAGSEQGRARIRRRENQGAGASGGRGSGAVSLEDIATINDPMEAARQFRAQFK